MGAPGYSLTNPTLIGHLTLFAQSFTWTSDTKGIDEEILRNETNRGYVAGEYALFYRNVLPGLQFRFPSTDYTAFETFITATRAVAFWFVPDSDDLSVKYNVRRRAKFLPKGIDPVRVSGTLRQRFDYVLELVAEVPDQPLED